MNYTLTQRIAAETLALERLVKLLKERRLRLEALLAQVDKGPVTGVEESTASKGRTLPFPQQPT